MNSKVGELEDEVREVFYRRTRKYFTGVFQAVSGKRSLLVRFQDGCEKDMTSNQLNIMILEKIPVNEEAKVPMVDLIPDESMNMDKGFYHVS